MFCRRDWPVSITGCSSSVAGRGGRPRPRGRGCPRRGCRRAVGSREPDALLAGSRVVTTLLAREGPETSAGPGDPVRTRRAWALRASRDDGQPPSPRQAAVSTEPPGSHWPRRAPRRARHPHARVSREACTKPANWTPRGPRGAEGFERQRLSATCRGSRPLSGGRLHAWFREVPAARARPVPPAAVARPSRWPWADTGTAAGQGTRCARPVLGPEATAPGARRPARALRPPRVRLYRASSWADCGSRTTASRKCDRRTKALGCQAGAPRLPPPHPWGPCDREFRRKRGGVISCFSAEPSRSQTLWEERRGHLGREGRKSRPRLLLHQSNEVIFP